MKLRRILQPWIQHEHRNAENLKTTRLDKIMKHIKLVKNYHVSTIFNYEIESIIWNLASISKILSFIYLLYRVFPDEYAKDS